MCEMLVAVGVSGVIRVAVVVWEGVSCDLVSLHM